MPHSRPSSLSATASLGSLSGYSGFKSTPVPSIWQRSGHCSILAVFISCGALPVIFPCASEQTVQCSLYSIQTVRWHPCTRSVFHFGSSSVLLRVLYSMHCMPTCYQSYVLLPIDSFKGNNGTDNTEYVLLSIGSSLPTHTAMQSEILTQIPIPVALRPFAHSPVLTHSFVEPRPARRICQRTCVCHLFVPRPITDIAEPAASQPHGL
ncbi:hypothetical protein GGI35DRAFT_78699 [Trichoderma velutinum]